MAKRSKEQRERTRAQYIRRSLKRCKSSRTLAGCRKQVFFSDDPNARAGRLYKEDLSQNSRNKVVSKVKSEQSQKRYFSNISPLRAWNEAARNTLDGYSTGYSPFRHFSPTSPTSPTSPISPQSTYSSSPGVPKSPLPYEEYQPTRKTRIRRSKRPQRLIEVMR